MRCSQLMETDVRVCGLSDCVAEVARLMRDRALGFVPVCDAQGRPVGVVTDRDLAIRVVATGRSVDTTPVSEVMTPLAITCSAGDEIEVAEQLMIVHQKGRVICTWLDGRLAGVISLADIFEVETSERACRIFRAIASREAMIIMV
jgi:CBS domain-containing protein